MKIEIHSAKHRHFNLHFPTRLVLNGLSAFLISHRLKHHAGKKIFTARQLRRIFRVILKERKRLGCDWEFIHIITHSGTQVRLLP